MSREEWVKEVKKAISWSVHCSGVRRVGSDSVYRSGQNANARQCSVSVSRDHVSATMPFNSVSPELGSTWVHIYQSYSTPSLPHQRGVWTTYQISLARSPSSQVRAQTNIYVCSQPNCGIGGNTGIGKETVKVRLTDSRCILWSS